MKISSLNNIFDWLPEAPKAEATRRLALALAGLKKIIWPIKAVILAGGYKHQEITHQQELGSDLDIFVFSNFLPLFWPQLQKYQNRINREKFIFHYRAVLPFFLSRSKTFWAYKLKNEALILSGGEQILDKILAKPDSIHKIESLRILLQTFGTWIKPRELAAQPINDFTILRVYLNIGEAYLTYFGKLAPSYKLRAAAVAEHAQTFGCSERIKNLVLQGYLTKTDPIQAQTGNNAPTLASAKQDCLEALDYLSSRYLDSSAVLPDKLDQLEKQVRPDKFFNLLFGLAAKKQGFLPRFGKLATAFNLFSLYRMIILMESGRRDEALALFQEFFRTEKFDYQSLLSLLQIPPLPVLIEVSI